MRLTLHTFLTLDGVMQAPGGPDRGSERRVRARRLARPLCRRGHGQRDGRVVRERRRVPARPRTYEIFAASWPTVTDPDDPIASKLNALPKHVASRTLDEVSWNNAKLIEGDVAEQVAALKRRAGPRDPGAREREPAQTLIKNDLIDEYRLLVYPVLLGRAGASSPTGRSRAALRLVDSRTTSAGVTLNTYESAGKPSYGSFELTPEGAVVQD